MDSPSKKRNRKVEDDICEAFNRHLQRLEMFNKTAPEFLCFHIPNEQVRFGTSNAHKHQQAGAKRKRMGVLAGVFDYQVKWLEEGQPRECWIEFKAERVVNAPTKKDPFNTRKERGRMSDAQKAFGERLDRLHIPWVVSYTPNQAVDFLIEQGAIKP